MAILKDILILCNVVCFRVEDYMLKKIGFYICIVVIMGLCIYSIYLMHHIDANYEVSFDDGEVIYINEIEEIYAVKRQNVIQTVQLEGMVVPVYGDENVEVVVEGEIADIKRFIQVGNVIEKDAIYASHDGREYKAKARMQCIGISEVDNGIRFEFVDYSKLYMEIGIPEKYIVDSLYNKEVLLTYNDREFKGNISFIDGYCNDGVVKATVVYKNEEELLRPGTKCNVGITIQYKENVLAVPLDYMMYSETEDAYKVMLVSENSSTVSVGVKVGIIGDDMVEIISGVKENSCIALPRDEMSLRYYLRNSKGVTK